MNDRLVFHDRLRWLPADIKSDNPHALTGLWHCPDHRPGVTLRLRVGESLRPCTARLLETRPDGTGILRFACSVKTRAGWKLLRFLRESPDAPSRVVATRLVFMPARDDRRSLRRHRHLLRARETALAARPVPRDGPLISVIMPVFNPSLDFLAKAIDSVRAQTYPRWQLCIADDASTDPDTLPFLRRQAAGDARIRVIARKTNGHISAASNSALSLADGDWCALLDQDDELSPHAFAAFVRALAKHPAAALVYTDEDKIDARGRRYGACHKPAWMPELLFAQNFVSHLGFYRTDRLRRLAGFRVGHEGCQDWDLVLRYTRDLPANQILHIPHVLYHWRAIPGSTAQSTAAKPYVSAAARLTVESALAERSVRARLTPFGLGQFHVAFEPPAFPRVAIVTLPSAAPFEPERIARLTDYPNLDFVSAPAGENAPLPALPAAARRTDADILVALPGGLAPRAPDWLRRLVGALALPGVGAAGGRIVSPEGRVIDGCLMLDHRGRARHAFPGIIESESGHYGRAALAHNPGGLSLHGIAIRRADLLAADDLASSDAPHSPQSAGWALCSRLRATGLRVVHDPGVQLEAAAPAPDAHDTIDFPTDDDPSLHHCFGGEWPPVSPPPARRTHPLSMFKKLLRKPRPAAIDPASCFTGNDTPAEHALASVCQNTDMRFLLSYRFLRGEGLEIGALHFPLPLAPGVRVKYYDYRSREENIRKYPELPADKIVRTDYVGDGEKLELVPAGSLDFLVANHMLEHCQDVIGTLKLFYSKLRPEGVLFISLPDLRHTFDCRRAPTPFEHLERDHREGPAVSLYSHYRDVLANWSDRQSASVRALNGGSREPLDEAAFHTAVRGTHVDWHFHAWTQSEIQELFLRLRRDHGLQWEIEAAARNGIEFITVLRKTAVETFDRNEPDFRPLSA